MMVRTVLAVFICWMFAAAATAQVYFWTDKNGVKHYSNVKPDDEVDFEEKKEDKDTSGAEQPQPPPSPSQPQQAAPQQPASSGGQASPQGASPPAAGSPPPTKPETNTDKRPTDVVASHRLNIQKFPISQDQLITEETARLQQLQAIFEQMGLSREERIAVETQRLGQAISDLTTAPTPKFGSQDNKRRQVGYYKYRLQELQDSPDKYFQNIATQGGAQ